VNNVVLVLCCAAVDSSAGGDPGAATCSLDGVETEETAGLRSWPPKSHTGGVPLPGTFTEHSTSSTSCFVPTNCSYTYAAGAEPVT